MKKIKFLLSLLLVFTALTYNAAYAQNNKDLVVLVKYKSQYGKDSLALSTLKILVEKVKKEPYYVNIIIHSDPVDKSNILLYEQWSSGEYYKGDHMNTSYLQQFINDSRSFLAGPPEITFWKIEN